MSARNFSVMEAVRCLQDRGWVVVSPAELRAGYRLLAPGELDAATIEACIEAVSQVKPIPALSGPLWEPQTSDFEAALRNLRGTNG